MPELIPRSKKVRTHQHNNNPTLQKQNVEKPPGNSAGLNLQRRPLGFVLERIDGRRFWRRPRP